MAWAMRIDGRGHVNLKPDKCGCDETSELNPTVLLTVSWTGAETSMSLFGCIFSKGETKELCSSAYTVVQNPTTLSKEDWRAYAGTLNTELSMSGIQDLSGTTRANQAALGFNFQENFDARGGFFAFSTQITSGGTPTTTFTSTVVTTVNLSTHDINVANFFPVAPDVADALFGQVTYPSITTPGLGNVTVKWERNISERSGQKHWKQTGGTVP